MKNLYANTEVSVACGPVVFESDNKIINYQHHINIFHNILVGHT